MKSYYVVYCYCSSDISSNLPLVALADVKILSNYENLTIDSFSCFVIYLFTSFSSFLSLSKWLPTVREGPALMRSL